jgi:hypothetical protein
MFRDAAMFLFAFTVGFGSSDSVQWQDGKKM